MKFKRKPEAMVIEAEQMKEAGTVLSLEGRMHYKAGDWLVTGIEGEKYPVADRIFQKTYEPVDSLIPVEAVPPQGLIFTGTGSWDAWEDSFIMKVASPELALEMERRWNLVADMEDPNEP